MVTIACVFHNILLKKFYSEPRRLRQTDRHLDQVLSFQQVHNRQENRYVCHFIGVFLFCSA